MAALLKEEADFARMPPERQANIEIVSSAYASVLGARSYLTMPVTTGRRFYEVLDRHGARDLAALESARPGALREEVILPNLAEADALAAAILGRAGFPLVVPGVFEARKQRWGQEEYMVLWMRLITGSVREVHLSPGWAYSNGCAAEYARAILIRHRAVEGREAPMAVLDEAGAPVPLHRGAGLLRDAILDLRRRGHPTEGLSRELGRIAGFAMLLAHEDRHGWARHTANAADVEPWEALDAARQAGAVPAYGLG